MALMRHFDAIGSDGIESGFDRRADPRATTGSLALESKPPALNLRHTSSDEFGSVAGIGCIGVRPLASGPHAGATL